ncbi:hypothetical protein [Microcoleus vaginatus]|uniref:hypothetical protein n=1 Tax=Microcoleus vaginatus TaxID=119532 RepID=UPI00403F8927
MREQWVVPCTTAVLKIVAAIASIAALCIEKKASFISFELAEYVSDNYNFKVLATQWGQLRRRLSYY